MRGRCRLLWSVILLTLVGCQSTPTGSTGLAGRLSDALTAPARQAAEGQGLAALFASRRAPDVDRRQQHNRQPQQTPSLSGRWADDEVLQMVLDQELADASPGERAALMQRLAESDEDEVADVLIKRRKTLQAAASSDPGSSDNRPADPSAQQIILTRQPESGAPTDQPQTASLAGHSRRQSDQTRRTHPLADESDRLAAPAPGGDRRPSPEEPTQVRTVSEDQQPAAAAVAVDAFGAGGESLAAQHQIAESSRIGLAGRDTIDAPDTRAEAIARDLDADKAAQSVYWQEDLDKLITLLEAQVAQQKPGASDYSRDQYIRQHVALRMLYLIASRQPEALRAIPAVSHDQQEFWTRMFWALANIFDEEAMPNSTVRAAETVAQLRAAIRQIEPRASLELRGSVFCRRIDGFGDFETFGDEPFAPGQPVLIYTEVRNFQSQSAEDGSYRTLLRSSITIQQGSVSGPVVFKHDLPATEDRCQSRRQDYFHSYRIQLPGTLKPGPYVLTLDVTDALTGKNGSTTLNFLVR